MIYKCQRAFSIVVTTKLYRGTSSATAGKWTYLIELSRTNDKCARRSIGQQTKPIHICYCYGPPRFHLVGWNKSCNCTLPLQWKIPHIITYLPIRFHFNENLIFEMGYQSACKFRVAPLLSRPSFTMLCVNVDSTTGLTRKISSREQIYSFSTNIRK